MLLGSSTLLTVMAAVQSMSLAKGKPLHCVVVNHIYKEILTISIKVDQCDLNTDSGMDKGMHGGWTSEGGDDNSVTAVVKLGSMLIC